MKMYNTKNWKWTKNSLLQYFKKHHCCTGSNLPKIKVPWQTIPQSTHHWYHTTNSFTTVME